MVTLNVSVHRNISSLNMEKVIKYKLKSSHVLNNKSMGILLNKNLNIKTLSQTNNSKVSLTISKFLQPNNFKFQQKVAETTFSTKFNQLKRSKLIKSYNISYFVKKSKKLKPSCKLNLVDVK